MEADRGRAEGRGQGNLTILTHTALATVRRDFSARRRAGIDRSRAKRRAGISFVRVCLGHI